MELVADLPLPQRIAVGYASAPTRPAWIALFALDARMAAIVRARREPIAAQLRLAWWRERLAEPAAMWPRGEPVLDTLRTWRDPACLAALPAGWEALIGDGLTAAVIAEFADARAEACACLGREVAAPHEQPIKQAARLWAVADLAANLSDGAERAAAVAYGRGLERPPLSGAMRPLAVLAALGARALAQGGKPLISGPGSLFLALRSGLAGK